MTGILDPVWPWSRLWEVLQQVPPGIRIVAGVAGVASLVVTLLWMARSRRPLLAGMGLFGGEKTKTSRSQVVYVSSVSVLLMSLVLLAHHTWGLVYSDSFRVTGSGFSAFFLAIAWQLGLAVLLLGPFALVGVGVGTYLGTPGLSRLRLGTILTLRLFAFLCTLIAIARPSLGWLDQEKTLSQLYIGLDRSLSMTMTDERGNLSRWAMLQRSMEASEPALTRLRDEQGVNVSLFTFAEDVQDITSDALGEPIGKRTDLGGALRQLFERRESRLTMRGLLLVSDGADNGGVPALAEAMRWRGAGCAISTFACGNPATTPKQNDVAITSIATSPSPFVPVKGKLNVRLSIDARGFENSKARVRLFLEDADGTDREMTAKDVTLPLTTGNDVTLTTDAPAKPGEIKVKATVETSEPDKLPFNNTIETFVTVSKEGISVLLVDRQRAHEPQFICDALANDNRIRVTPVWVRGGKPLPGTSRLRRLDEQPFDVILLGDVTAEQLRSLDSDAISKIEKQVSRGAGLMVLGGYVNLGNGGWRDTELAKMLPVDLTEREQRDTPVSMQPTDDGLRLARYLFRIDDTDKPKQAWSKLAKLDGMTMLKLPEARQRETVLAVTQRGDPLLVMQLYGGSKDAKAETTAAARVLVFGGDTTYRWVSDEEGQRFHERFWRQVVVWLARQEDAEGNVWVRPDVRRLPVRSELGFGVELRGKGGGPDLREGNFEVEVVAPDGTKARVPLMRSTTTTRGIVPTMQPGVYKVNVKGEGKDPSGGVVSGEASARVIVYDEDLELSKPAADPEFLRKLATAGGGEALRVEQLADFLNRLAEQPLNAGKPKMDLRPDWRTTNRSSFLVLFFVLFSVIVSLEWGLRRYWGMV